ncbi:MAG: acyl-CoA dehydrogenase family protein [Polyangiales bacterium]
MRFAFTDDQKMLRDTVREVLQRECPPDVVRAVWNGDVKPAEAVWATLAETGVIGMAANETAGGMAMTTLDSVLPFEEIGYAGLPGLVVDTVAVGIPLLEAIGTEAQRDRWAADVASGVAKIAVAFEGQTLVAHASDADLLIAEREGVGYCIPMSEVALMEAQSVDRARRLRRVSFDPANSFRARPDADHRTAWVLAKERATLATAAELAGLTRRMLDMSVQYAKDREQFGKPIGAQQAVKHRLADALIKQEFARPLVYRAAWSMTEGADTAEIDVSLAKIYAGDAARFVAKQALQVHGAIGYTIEYDLHMWMKRAWALAASHGDSTHHRERVGRHVL